MAIRSLNSTSTKELGRELGRNDNQPRCEHGYVLKAKPEQEKPE